MKTKAAEALETQHTQIAKVIPIRTETVLCQYPIHKLSKGKKTIQIKLTRENERGKVETTWKVSPNAEYGHPGILAYHLDTLFINRLFYELHPNIPEVIKIADGLRDICSKLGKNSSGKNTNDIKRALYQNALVGITAKLEYTGNDKKRRSFEFTSTRYGVVMIGESLPDGTKAEAVYIVLNPLFREVLRNAKFRPLDYDYLKSLVPTAQRWYELVSFQIFAALNLGNPRAKYRYSELCSRAPLATRFDTWKQAKKQLGPIHKPHIESGYISKFEPEETTDEQGRIDWFLWYTPGKKAKQEYREFNERTRAEDTLPKPAPRPRLVEALGQGREESGTKRMPGDATLIEKLTGYGIDESRAARLIESDREECEVWAAAWPHQNQKGMENPAAVLITFIESKRRPLPKGYTTAIAHEERRKKHEEQEARERAEDAYVEFFEPAFRKHQREELQKIQQENADAYTAFKTHFDKAHGKGLRMITSETQREKFTLRKAEEFFNKFRPELGVKLSDFWEWDERHNSDECDPVEWFAKDSHGIFAEMERRFREGN